MAVKRFLRFSGQMEAEIFTILNQFFYTRFFLQTSRKN